MTVTVTRIGVTVAAIFLGTLGCSAEEAPPTQTTSTPPSAAAEPSTASAPPTSSGAVGISPGGVTTSVDAGAESLEEEYFQACHTARLWMDAHGGDGQTLIEPYLATLQSSDSAGPGTFGTPWSQLPPGRQSAVIVAVEAAADSLCG